MVSSKDATNAVCTASIWVPDHLNFNVPQRPEEEHAHEPSHADGHHDRPVAEGSLRKLVGGEKYHSGVVLDPVGCYGGDGTTGPEGTADVETTCSFSQRHS